MRASYHYRVEVATGHVDEVRALLERFATIVSQNDGSIAAKGNDTTVLGVVAEGFESLIGLKSWADGHPAEELNLVTAVGTPMAVHDTDAESLRAAVHSHPELEPSTLAPIAAGSAWRYEWRYTGPRTEGGPKGPLGPRG